MRCHSLVVSQQSKAVQQLPQIEHGASMFLQELCSLWIRPATSCMSQAILCEQVELHKHSCVVTLLIRSLHVQLGS